MDTVKYSARVHMAKDVLSDVKAPVRLQCEHTSTVAIWTSVPFFCVNSP